jgi:hypothetical protein
MNRKAPHHFWCAVMRCGSGSVMFNLGIDIKNVTTTEQFLTFHIDVYKNVKHKKSDAWS